VVGAVPGALPPVAGWAAARGSIDMPACVLFAIIYLWQLPHTLAIAQLYREDFQRAGIHLLATDDPQGGATARQMIINTLALMAVAMMPTMLHFAGLTYFVVAIVLGALMLSSAIQFAYKPDVAGARRVLVASLIYLPALLLVMVLDKI
jgi:protoheme IX farnesyltransferase